MAGSLAGSKAKRGIPLRLSKLLLDRGNVKLLRELQIDPRLGITELARRVSLSPPTVRERLTRLEESGVIAGWRLAVDPAALGYPLLAFIRVRPMAGQVGRIPELAQRIPQVVECHRITGEDCFIMKVHFVAIDELDAVLDRFLVFGQTTTSIVQSTPVPLRDLPLPSAR
jgi:Lrp/AsnC family leucine-responsive transcriptional regulator